MPASTGERLYVATSLADAVAALADRGPAGAPLAGATWIMRAPIRREELRSSYVGIGGIAELRSVEMTDDEIHIGACVTHADLIAALAGVEGCDGLVAAAGGAANPAVRQMATVGGNLCTSDFPASDLSPALLCLDASVELRTPSGQERVPLGRLLDIRRTLEPGTLVTGVVIARKPVQTGHSRLPLRKAGDYPVAIVSMAVALGSDGLIEDIKVAVGSVEASARRWPQLEAQLLGHPLDPAKAYELAKAGVGVFAGRESVEAPGWYRVQVLPTLVRRAAQAALAARQQR
ncbi:FAD binding domain-containing protein [Mesorhizobium sp. YC-39]|uniref:FAD binding domain-containing protein n=1 Tax=unclassified Mesorhizobium TaxID=325217 RepID=UPI0021E91514|nr:MULTISPECIES: FAD binding domain-containing protein [unclassified Mesorhizobium]MCV3205292.1 FAD binding domain-containing protein [Mesorhizobium sp. YC-2]MCV3228309.1 FAD binding domain-containing protein [Mesorhizobium sp. YC-39]